MKVAFIVSSLMSTGPIIVVNNIIKYILPKVELVEVYYFDEEINPIQFDCNIIKINKNEKIDFDKYDIIHSHTFRADLYLYKNKKNIKRAKIISTIHQDTFKSLQYQYNFLISLVITSYWCLLYKKFDGITTISNILNTKYSKFIFNKLETIYNGCDVELVKKDSLIEDKIVNFKKIHSKIIGSYAYITKRKGISQIIDAMKKLDSSYGLIIIGEGPELKNLEKKVIENNLNDRILFLPFVKYPYSYLDYFDIYAMPSYSEGFGLAMVEAALYKKSIVCSKISSFLEMFNKDEVNFFELNNPESLAKKIIHAYEFKEKFGELAFLKAKNKYVAEIMSANYLEYYKKITNKFVMN